MPSSMYLYSVVVLALIGLSAASHGRFGSINFQKNPSNPKLVTITANVAWRRTYFGSPNVGSTIYDIYLDFGDNSGLTLPFVVTSINTQDDWLTAVWTGTHQYASAGTYHLAINTCCRIFALNNNPSYSYSFTATLQITSAEAAGGQVNNSPVSNMLPIISVPLGVNNFQYQLLAADPESDAMRFAMSTPAQMGDGSSIQPPGLTVDASTGLVTLTQNLARGYWSTQQTVTDTAGNMIVIDYLISVEEPKKFCNGTCQNSNAAACSSDADCVACDSRCLTAVPRIVVNSLSSSTSPATNLPAPADGSTISVNPGQTTVLSFVVDDVNLFNPATAPYIFTASVPAYAVVSAQRDCTSANGCEYRGTFQKPQFIQITLQPTTASAGTNSIVCVGATSLGNPLPNSQHCVNLDVVAQVCGNGVVEGTEVCDGQSCCASNCMSVKSSGDSCRASAGACDVAETCDGTSVTCPADSYASASTVCRTSAGPCDVAETCSGSAAACPGDSFASTSVECRASAGVCDVAETCSGSAVVCPVDSFVSAGVSCRASAGVCDVAETCSGVAAACPSDAMYGPSVVCRPAADNCDLAETCTLGNSSCPTNKFNDTKVCRSAAVVCPRLPNAGAGAANYWCSPFNQTQYYMCQTGAWALSSVYNNCAPGTKCMCPYGVDCGKCGGPCTLPSNPPPTPDTC